MTRYISNNDDVIDSRDVIERIEDLQGDREALKEAAKEAQAELDRLLARAEEAGRLQDHTQEQLEDLQEKIEAARDAAEQAVDAFREWAGCDETGRDLSEEAEELEVLEALAEEARGSLDWIYGETLIRDSYFEDYARELAEDIGAIDRKANWPLHCIDWEQAADELKMDYTSVEYGAVTYWIRS